MLSYRFSNFLRFFMTNGEDCIYLRHFANSDTSKQKFLGKFSSFQSLQLIVLLLGSNQNNSFTSFLQVLFLKFYRSVNMNASNKLSIIITCAASNLNIGVIL
jgi:hypothetical protein